MKVLNLLLAFVLPISAQGLPAVLLEGLSAVIFIRHLFYPPSFLSAGCVADWRTVLGKSS